MYNRLELASILKNAYSDLDTINEVINKSIENGFYEDEKVLIMASKKGSGVYRDIYEFDFEWNKKYLAERDW